MSNQVPTALEKFFMIVPEQSGTPLPQRPIVNFRSGFTVTDDPVNNATNIDGGAGAAPTPLFWAALASTTPAGTQDYRALAGYSAVNDGGGGFVFNNATSTATPDGVTTSATGSGTGRWQRLYEEHINVRWAGAKGDGSTNDRAAIALADAAAQALGLGLLFPAGTYLNGGASLAIASDVRFGAGSKLSSGSFVLNGSIDARPAQQVFGSGATITFGSSLPADIHVGWWGALGVASDDGPAINAAIAAGANGGRIVFLPGKTYSIETPVVVDYSVNSAIGLSLECNSWAAAFSGPQATLQANFTARTGTAASITALSLDPNGSGFDRIVTLTGLTGMLASDKGSQFQISSTGTAGNAGTFTIVTVHSSSSIDIFNYQTVSLTNPATAAVAPDGNNGSIHWAVLPPLIQERSAGCRIVGLDLNGNGTAGTLVDSTYPASGAINTDNKFAGCRFRNAPYHVTIGDFGPLATYPDDCEFFNFSKCYFVQESGTCIAALWIPNTTGQSKKHEFENCSWAVGGGTMQRCIQLQSGSFNTRGCSWNGASVTAIQLGAITDTINILQTDVEGCNRFLVTPGEAITRWNINIEKGRFGITNGTLASDGQYIQYSLGGGLNLDGCDFSQGVTGIGRFSIGLFGAEVPTVKATMQNCYFPTSVGNSVVTGYNGSVGIAWHSRACTQFDGTGTVPTPIPDGTNFDVYNGASIAMPGGEQITSLAHPEAPITLVNGANVDVGQVSGGHNYSTPCTNWQLSGPTGAFSIASIVVDGTQLAQVKEIFYEGGQTLTISHQAGAGTAAYRIVSPTGADLVGVTYARLIYNKTLARWLVVASNVSLVPTLTTDSLVVMGIGTASPNERKLTAGTNITITDGGAGGNATISAAATSSVTLGGDVTGPSNANDVASLSGAGGTTNAIPLRSGAYLNPTAGQTIIRIGSTPILGTGGTSGNTTAALAADLTVSLAANATTLALFDSTNGVTLGAIGGATTLKLNAGSGDYIGFGATPAGSGFVRLPNAGAINAAKAGGGTIGLLTTDASNNVYLGDSGNANIMFVNSADGGLLQMGGTTVADYSTALGFAITGALKGGSRATSAPLNLGLSATPVTATSGTVVLTAEQTQCPAIQVNTTLTGNLEIDMGGVTGWWQLDLSQFTQTPPYTLTLKNGTATSVNGSEASFPTLVGVLCTGTNRIATGFIG